MTVFLAIDTATSSVGISLDDGTEVLSERIFRTRRHHTAELAPQVAQTLRNTGTSPDDLTGIAVAKGPGSYTGLRIGMALAKGMALAHDLPLVGIPTLDIVAAAQPQREGELLAVLRAGRGRVAAVWYKWGPQGWQAQAEPEALTWEEALDRVRVPTYACGEISGGAEQLRKHPQVVSANPAACVRRPSVMAVLARQAIEEGIETDPRALTPVYLGDLESSKS